MRRLLFWLRDRRPGVFRFHDGRRWRGVDPFVAYRGLRTHATFDVTADPAQAQLECVNPDETGFEACRRTVRAVRDVFGVPEFEAGGLTEEGCINLLADFIDYTGLQKKSGSPQPTSPPATGSESSEGSQASAGSGCI